MASEDSHDEAGLVSPEAKAKLIEEESRGLNWCLQHELVVWWDGPGNACPACAFQRQQREEAAKVFLEMTKEMKDN